MVGSVVHLTCTDVYTFPVLQLWIVCIQGVLLQSRFFMYHLLLSHALSRSPNTALRSIQPFKEHPDHYGSGFHHNCRGYGCIQHTTRHFLLSVINLYVTETDFNIKYLKSTIHPWKPCQVQMF